VRAVAEAMSEVMVKGTEDEGVSERDKFSKVLDVVGRLEVEVMMDDVEVFLEGVVMTEGEP